MKSPPEQRDVRGRPVPEELAVPDPGASGRLPLRSDHHRRPTVHFEVVPVETEPYRPLAGEGRAQERLHPFPDPRRLGFGFRQRFPPRDAGPLVARRRQPGIPQQHLPIVHQPVHLPRPRMRIKQGVGRIRPDQFLGRPEPTQHFAGGQPVALSIGMHAVARQAKGRFPPAPDREVGRHRAVHVDHIPASAAVALSAQPVRVPFQNSVVPFERLRIAVPPGGERPARQGHRIEGSGGDVNHVGADLGRPFAQPALALLEALEPACVEREVDTVVHPVAGDHDIRSDLLQDPSQPFVEVGPRKRPRRRGRPPKAPKPFRWAARG
jgi:hypothetical protein